MHVHLAEVKTTLMKAVSDVHHTLGKTTWHVNCGGGTTLNNCRVLKSSETPNPDTDLKVSQWPPGHRRVFSFFLVTPVAAMSFEKGAAYVCCSRTTAHSVEPPMHDACITPPCPDCITAAAAAAAAVAVAGNRSRSLATPQTLLLPSPSTLCTAQPPGPMVARQTWRGPP
jgi:hypothetical protein